MLRRRLALVFASLFLLTAPASAQNDDERITSFDSDITFARDGGLHVRDTIVVMATGKNIKHGIYFDLPGEITTDDASVLAPPGGISVTRDGNPEPFELVTGDSGPRLKIGSKDVLLEPGSHTYTVAYSSAWITRDHVKALLSATGPGWNMLIDRAHADIHAPTGGRIANTVAYIGTAASFDHQVNAQSKNDAEAIFDSEASIPSGESFLIGLDIDLAPGKDAI